MYRKGTRFSAGQLLYMAPVVTPVMFVTVYKSVTK